MRIKALDSIRGFLLLQMTLDHFGKPISHYLFQCFGFFSAAEGFFFLSGFVGMMAALSKAQVDKTQSWMRKRALRIWVYHMLTLVGLAFIAFLFIPNLTSYFKSLYEYPILATFWASLMVYTPMWLDVLPLYVIFLMVGSFIFPFFVGAKSRRRIVALWFVSFIVWIFAQFGLRDFFISFVPEWIHHGTFDPLGWQFAYFTGAATIAWWRFSKKNVVSSRPWNVIRIVNLMTPVLFVLFVFCFMWSHQFIKIPFPSEFWTSREHLGIFRFANFYIFMLLVCFIVRVRQNWLDFRPLNTIGRHSLDVYTAHIILIYMWFTVVPNSIRYHVPWSIIIPIFACFLLWGGAKFQEFKVNRF